MPDSTNPAAAEAICWEPQSSSDVNWVAWANALPLCQETGLVCLELNENSGTFRMDRTTTTPNPSGAVNGGILALATDQVMGAMTVRISPRGLLPATASLHIQFHKPAMAPLTFRVISLGGGRRTKFIEVVIEDADGNRCATGHGTMVAGGSPATPSL